MPNNDELGSKLIGLNIYNNSNQGIGQIKDIAIDHNGSSQASWEWVITTLPSARRP